MRAIDVVGLAQLSGTDDLRGDIMAAVHHVQMHVAISRCCSGAKSKSTKF